MTKKRDGQQMRVAVDGDLSLLHRLEERALRLGRRAIHFIGQEHLRKDWAPVKDKLPRGRIENGITQDIGGQQVARELHASEFEAKNPGQRVRQRRLAHAGDVLDQQMSARQQTTEGHANSMVLAQKDRIEPGQHIIDRDAHACLPRKATRYSRTAKQDPRDVFARLLSEVRWLDFSILFA